MTQTDQLIEQITDWNQHSQVEPERRLVSNVALAGISSRNGYEYTAEALAAAVPLYNGKPVFLDHAAGGQRPSARSTRDLVGSIINPRFENGRLRGDIRVVETDSGRTFLALVDANTPGVGMSHVVLAERAADGRSVQRIQEVISVDVVVNPATTSTFQESLAELEKPASVAHNDTGPTAALLDPRAHFDQLEAELSQLREQRDQLQTQLAQLQREQRSRQFDELLAESGLPSFAIDADFRDRIFAAPTLEQGRTLIQERAQLLQRFRQSAPHSHQRHTDHPHTDRNAILAAIKQRR